MFTSVFRFADIDFGVSDPLYALYLDPTGGHVIASFATGDNFYVSRHSKKMRPLLKLKVWSPDELE